MSKRFYLDLTDCKLPDDWFFSTVGNPRILPVRAGLHHKDVDVCEDEMPGWREKHGERIIEHNLRKYSHVAEVARELPIGFNLADLPIGARLVVIALDAELPQ